MKFSDCLNQEKRKQLNQMRKTKKQPESARPTVEHLSERDLRQLMGARAYGRGRGGAIRQTRY